MKIDIIFREKGVFNEDRVFKDVKEHNISVVDDIYLIRFYHAKKGIERYLDIQIPKSNLAYLVVRKIEDGD
jgi:hypothetical protein